MLPRGAGRLVTPPSDKMRALGSQPVCVRVCVCACVRVRRAMAGARCTRSGKSTALCVGNAGLPSVLMSAAPLRPPPLRAPSPSWGRKPPGFRDAGPGVGCRAGPWA